MGRTAGARDEGRGLLGRLDHALENLERVVREICAADVEPDGMVFDPATVKTERIKEDADYEGVRVRFVGLLGKARAAMQIDVGFGEVVTPSAQEITYPALLDFPSPALAGYPRETVVAAKFQAIAYLRTLNSRMKDFYDVWLLASRFAFDGAVLAKAIAATFKNRETAIDVVPIAFTPDFTEQASTLAQWTAFRKRLPNTECPEKLSEIVPLLAEFLLPSPAPMSAVTASSSAGHRAGRGRPGPEAKAFRSGLRGGSQMTFTPARSRAYGRSFTGGSVARVNRRSRRHPRCSR